MNGNDISYLDFSLVHAYWRLARLVLFFRKEQVSNQIFLRIVQDYRRQEQSGAITLQAGVASVSAKMIALAK